MAHNLLKSMEEHLGQPLMRGGFSDSFPNILKLLSMNNVAQICYDELGDYEQMTVAVSSMQRMMVADECFRPPLFLHRSNSSVLPDLVSEEDVASLMINANLLVEPRIAEAA